jgi:predicted ATPase
MSNIMLKSLYVHNFKSFYRSKFEFGKVNCLIAPNNTGKSNLLEVLTFLDNLIYQNVARAIAKVGFKKLRNYHYPDENVVHVNAQFMINNQVLVGDELIQYDIELNFIFSLNYEQKTSNIDILVGGKIKNTKIDKADLKNGFGLRIFHDLEDYIINYTLYNDTLKRKKNRSFRLTYNHNTLNYSISNTQYQTTDEIIKNLFALNIKKDNESLSSPIDLRLFFNRSSLFVAHCFHAHAIKRVQEVGYPYLLEDGTNLPDYLKNLNKETFEDISTSLIGEVELINAIEIRDSFTTELIFKEEINGEVNDLELREVSDGTIHFIAIMSAIMGNKNSIGLLIEEPERHMHMKVLSTILNTMRDDDKQMFFTTHSTELLQHLELDEIVFMFRDYEGDTRAQRAVDIFNIEKFMSRYKNDLVEMIKFGVVGEYEE